MAQMSNGCRKKSERTRGEHGKWGKRKRHKMNRFLSDGCGGGGEMNER